jgi:multicomponent Na+:H+ antiporter subunit G
MIEWIAYICFAISFVAFGIGTLGIFRLPDAYSRMHAVAIGDSIGVGIVGLGLILLSPNWILRIKLIAVIILYWIVNPTMTHLVAKIGLIQGTKPIKGTKLWKG